MQDSKLRELQLKELEILMMLQNLCDANDIKYSLFAGTAIGAVRHNGFIPWDDDLDICMSRGDYNKFKIICETKLDKKYFYQDYHTDREFNQCFCKIRDNDTTFIESSSANINCNKGIFVDIFPLDFVPDNIIKMIIQRLYAALNMLIARGYPSKRNGRLLKIVCKIVLKVIPKNRHYSVNCYCERKLQKYNAKSIGVSNLTTTFNQLKLIYPDDLLNDTIMVEFEGEKMPLFKQYDKYLNTMYGDYMKLPPEEERQAKHAGFIIDTKVSYTKYILKKGLK